MSDERDEVEARAYRLISMREHGREELARKLRQRDFEPGAIEEVIQELERLGYIDDQRFAREQSAILVRKCWGPRQIRGKLRKRGVDAEAIEAAMEALDEEVNWFDVARERLESRFGEAKDLDQATMEKAFRHLRYRGFRPHRIRRLLFDDGR